MEFWKINGAGNDFLVIDNLNGEIESSKWPGIIRKICERHLSIGADGLMVVEKSDIADYKMIYYNKDGSLGEMCGNGARCICRFGYEYGLAGEVQHVETSAGLVTGERLDKRLYRVRLNDPEIIKLNCKALIDDREYKYAYVELGKPGVPHIVVHIENLQEYPEDELCEIGRKLRFYKDLPKGANVNFYEITGKDHVYEKTYERGVEDFTYACGTGTGSMVTVLTLQDKVSGHNVKVDMMGGQLIIDINRKDKEIKDLYLTGLTNIVAKGIVTDEELEL